MEYFTGVLAYKRANLSVVSVKNKDEINAKRLATYAKRKISLDDVYRWRV